jgi:nitronate monooxygenase
MALVPQVVDAVTVPVIAAGGIADGRGIAAALALGAAGVQVGTAYLFTPEATVSPLHKAALGRAAERPTALTNLLSGRPARSLMNRLMREAGPLSDAVPDFPTAGGALAPLKAKAEAAGADDFSSLWSGQAAALGRALGSGELTQVLAEDALRRLAALSGAPSA